jgi:hypothetical protein
MTEEELLRKELESLSDEELAEYEARIQQEAPEEQAPIEQPQPEEERGMVESAALGAVEGVPFAKDVIAAGETVLESGMDNFGENFSRNQDEWNQAINEAEEQNPVSFFLGDMASGFALPATRGLKAMMAFGALSGVSRSEDRTVFDAASGAVISGVLGTAGDKVFKAGARYVNKIGKSLGVIADETTKDVIDNAAYRKKLNQHIEKWFDGEDLAEKSAKYADFLLKKDIIKEEDSIEMVSKKFMNMRKNASSKMSKLLDEADRPLDQDEIGKVYRKMKESLNIDDLATNAGEEGKQKATSLLKRLDDEFIEFQPTRDVKRKVIKGLDPNGNPLYDEVVEQIADGAPIFRKKGLKELHNMKVSFGDEASNLFDKSSSMYNPSKGDYYKKGAGVLSETLDELTSGDKTLKKLNKEWAIAHYGEDATKAVYQDIKGGAMQKLKNAFNLRTVLLTTGAIGAATERATIGTGLGAAALTKVTMMIKDPNVNPQLAVKLKKLANHLQIEPDSKYVKRLATQAGLSNDSFRDALSGTFAELNLMENAVARDSKDVIAKSDDILQALQFHNPQLAAQLREAIDADDPNQIGPIMDQISRDPETRDFIQQGMGWDGKVYSPEDKAMLIEQLQEQATSGQIDFAESLMLQESVKLTGQIPQPKPKRDNYNKLQKRDKDRPRY